MDETGFSGTRNSPLPNLQKRCCHTSPLGRSTVCAPPKQMDAAIAARLYPPPLSGAGLNFSLSLTTFATQWRKLEVHLPALLHGLRSGKIEDYVSGEGQDRWVDQIFKGRRREKLFMVESGAFDGVLSSNTLFLEAVRGWGCLLVEANPLLLPVILGTRRRCHVFSGGLQMSDKPVEYADFHPAHTMGSFDSFVDKEMLSIVKAKVRLLKNQIVGKDTKAEADTKSISVPSFPLHRILLAAGQRVVDYWSLDTQGSEPLILAHTNFSAIEVGVLTVEHEEHAARRYEICKTLEQRGFTRVQKTGKDDYFANRAYFERRGFGFSFGAIPCPSSLHDATLESQAEGGDYADRAHMTYADRAHMTDVGRLDVGRLPKHSNGLRAPKARSGWTPEQRAAQKAARARVRAALRARCLDEGKDCELVRMMEEVALGKHEGKPESAMVSKGRFLKRQKLLKRQRKEHGKEVLSRAVREDRVVEVAPCPASALGCDKATGAPISRHWEG